VTVERPVQAERQRPWWRAPYPLYYYFVHIPIAIAALCVTMVTAAGWPAWAGVALGLGIVVLLIPAGRAGSRLGDRSNLEHAAMDKVPRPRKCDRCGEVEPTTCIRPWKLAACPLRSIETGQTYQDFMPAKTGGRR
jgi:hypothetical protein